MSSRLTSRFFLLCLSAFALFAIPRATGAPDWIVPTADELSATASTIDPEAGAEILYRFKQIDDSTQDAPVTDEYIRIKVYNEKGVRDLDKVDIPYNNKDERIRAIATRVIKPDGSIVEVDKKAFYDREIVKLGNLRMHVRSFSFPGLEPGVIVEYKWTITAKSNIYALKLDFLGAMPTRHVIFRLKPLTGLGLGSESYFYLYPERMPERTKDGFSVYEMRDLPAAVDEPFMPPPENVRPWMVFYPRLNPVYYGGENISSVKSRDFWVNYAGFISEPLEQRLKKTSPLVRETAASITRGAATPRQALEMICDYCRAGISNFDYVTPQGGLDPKIRAREKRTPEEIIRTKLASSSDMQLVFIALARAAGIDARAALCSDRSRGTFASNLRYPYFLADEIVAVKLDGAWAFYDPARCLVPSGKLRWQNTQGTVLIVQPKGIEWATTPRPALEDSLVKRTGTFRFNEEGTLFGDVRIEYGGLAEIDAREDFFLQTQEKIEEIIRERVQARIPLAEVTDVRAENSSDVLKRFAITYSVKAPGYAENAGQRFFVQPAFFSKGRGAMFTADTRVNDIYFNYPINEEDSVTMNIPHWLKIEEGSAPRDFEKASWGKYHVTLAFKKSTSTILYSRAFQFSPTSIAAKGYPLLKSIFNQIHTSDAHALTLRVGGGSMTVETKDKKEN